MRPDGRNGIPQKADMNLAICTECGAKLPQVAEYHPYAFCVLVRAGLNPLTVVTEGAKALGVGRQT